MFRELRRKAQELTKEECTDILVRAKTGILGVNGDNGYPYAVPVNFAWESGKITFHGAPVGHKIESIRRDGRVSFTVIDRDDVIARDRTTAYRSVIIFGIAREITDREEKIRACRLVGYKYSGDFPELVEEEIAEAVDHTCCVEITVEHMTGKEGLYLHNQRISK
ncbi:MAG: pyridoxamine 5'-phosphate oxidase family protein, partial [Lachnospiraceae bacterium]|nr:pyridoxamine 5'-phosphate oxidase family protein [Lachnospiraceae bacterium]